MAGSPLHAQESWQLQPLLRPLATDRPDRTESPYSVPKGWMQVETDLVTHGEFKRTDETVTSTSIGAFNLKFGLTNRMDVQMLFTPWVRTHFQGPGIDDDESGTGQAGLRAKFNLAGNDGGDVGAGVMPFVFIPTRGDAIFDAPTWGVLLPVSMAVTDGFAMSSMLGATRVENEDWWVTGSVSFGTALTERFAAFLEVYVSRSGLDEDALEDVTGDVGLTFAPSENWQLDAGVYYGLTDPTEDWRVFAGASARFDLSR
ncbi:MAG TPA: transporter [Candidatus Krumholzibacteria bacterium]